MTRVPRSPFCPEITKAEAEIAGMPADVAQSPVTPSKSACTRYWTLVQVPTASVKVRAVPE